jgi:hypothetical protein
MQEAAAAGGEQVSHQTWLAQVENEATSTSVCGLEISFQSIPQERHIVYCGQFTEQNIRQVYQTDLR